jgi:hypothetical protein
MRGGGAESVAGGATERVLHGSGKGVEGDFGCADAVELGGFAGTEGDFTRGAGIVREIGVHRFLERLAGLRGEGAGQHFFRGGTAAGGSDTLRGADAAGGVRADLAGGMGRDGGGGLGVSRESQDKARDERAEKERSKRSSVHEKG